MKSYICVLSTDNYLDGVLVLNENLKMLGTKYPLICLINENISKKTRDILDFFKIEYKIIEQVKYDHTNKEHSHWQFTFDKLNVFKLLEYEKIVYLDSDFLILRNIDELFNYEPLSLPLDLPFKKDGFCSGVMVIKPNIEDYNKLIKHAQECNEEGRGISDQQVINECFDDIKQLPIEYNVVRTIDKTENPCYDYLSNSLTKKHHVRIFMDEDPTTIVHYIGKLKPFMLSIPFDDEYALLYNYYLEQAKRKMKRYEIFEKESLISIIIPVYNNEKTLERCLTSIQKQTYHNLEILIIDDNSNDNSIKICKNLSKKDNRIKIFENESTKGKAYSKNIGLKNAKGQYIGFIYPEDYISENMYELLLTNIYIHGLDFYQIGTNLSNGNVIQIKEPIIRTAENTKIFDQFLLYDNFSVNIFDKLFTKNIINDVLFDENLSKYEDQKFMYDILKKCVYIGAKNDLLYHYDCNKNNSLFDNFQYDKDIEKINVLNDLKKWIEKNYPDKIKSFYIYYVYELKGFFSSLLSTKFEKNEVKKLVDDILNDSENLKVSNLYEELCSLMEEATK